jgi:hypothetical protein
MEWDAVWRGTRVTAAQRSIFQGFMSMKHWVGLRVQHLGTAVHVWGNPRHCSGLDPVSHNEPLAIKMVCNSRLSDGCRSSPTGGGRGASHRRTRRRWRGSRCPRTPGTGRGPGCSGRTPGCTGWQPSYRREQCASAQQHPPNVRTSSAPIQGHARGDARARSPSTQAGTTRLEPFRTLFVRPLTPFACKRGNAARSIR